MRLAEIAETPGEQGSDAERRVRGVGFAVDEHVQEVGIKGLHLCQKVGRAAERANRNRGYGDNAEKHQQALKKVGPAHGKEAACEGIGNDDNCAHQQRHHIRNAEHGGEQLGTGHKAGSGIKQEKYQNKYGCDDRNHAAFIMKTVFEKLRKRDCIVSNLGILAQGFGNQQPVQISTHGKADGDPAGGNAGQISGAGQTHQQPAGHI